MSRGGQGLSRTGCEYEGDIIRHIHIHLKCCFVERPVPTPQDWIISWDKNTVSSLTALFNHVFPHCFGIRWTVICRSDHLSSDRRFKSLALQPLCSYLQLGILSVTFPILHVPEGAYIAFTALTCSVSVCGRTHHFTSVCKRLPHILSLHDWIRLHRCHRIETIISFSYKQLEKDDIDLWRLT